MKTIDLLIQQQRDHHYNSKVARDARAEYLKKKELKRIEQLKLETMKYCKSCRCRRLLTLFNDTHKSCSLCLTSEEDKKLKKEAKHANTKICKSCRCRRLLTLFNDTHKSCSLCLKSRDDKKLKQEAKHADTKKCSTCRVRRKLDCYVLEHKTCSICRTPKIKPIKEGIKCSTCKNYKPEEAFKLKKSGLTKCCMICLEKRKSKK